jgi:DNA polymerase III alpha subunit
MVEKHNIDKFGRSLITEHEVCKLLYQNPKLEISNISLSGDSKFNQSLDKLYVNWPKIKQLEEILESPEDWHAHNQLNWFMPTEYQQLDIAVWLLDQCNGDVELQRCGQELLLYAERDMLSLLRYLKYLVDTMRQNQIIWGVGRGSSVASFVLYLIGIHRINSIYYDLDITEFIR